MNVVQEVNAVLEPNASICLEVATVAAAPRARWLIPIPQCVVCPLSVAPPARNVPAMQFVMKRNVVFVLNRMWATIADIRVRHVTVVHTRSACWPTDRRNVSVHQDIRAMLPWPVVAATLMSVAPIPALPMPFAATQLEVISASVLVVPRAMPIVRAVPRRRLWAAPMPTLVRWARAAYRMRSRAAVSAFADRVTSDIRRVVSARMWMSAPYSVAANPPVASTHSARTCLAATSVAAHRDTRETPSSCARSAAVPSVSARHLTNCWATVACSLAAQVVKPAPLELSASRLPAELATVPVPRVTRHSPTAAVWMSMNVRNVEHSCVRMELSASISKAATLATAPRDTKEMPTTDSVHRRNASALRTRSVPAMRSAYSQESVCVHHHTSLTHRITTSARVPARDSPVASMPSAHPQIHHSACARRASREIPCWAAPTRMSAPICPVPMGLTV